MDYPNDKYRSSLAELTEKIGQGPRLPRPPIYRQPILHLVLTVVVVVAAVGGYFAYKQHKASREAQELAARRAEFESQIARFAEKHNAVIDWQKPLLAKGALEKTYSLELARLLVRPDGRPILVFASLDNVSESGGRTLIYLDEATRLESHLKLRLDCTPEQAHFAMSAGSPQTFAVIAQIRSVEYVLADDYSLATGQCVDLMSVSASDYVDFFVTPQMEKAVHHADE
jgi:hypothetical protein